MPINKLDTIADYRVIRSRLIAQVFVIVKHCGTESGTTVVQSARIPTLTYHCQSDTRPNL